MKNNRTKQGQKPVSYEYIGVGYVTGGTPWTNDPGSDEVKSFLISNIDAEILGRQEDGERAFFQSCKLNLGVQLSHGANFNYGSRLLIVEVVTQVGATLTYGTQAISGTLTDVINAICDKPFSYRVLKTKEFGNKNLVLDTSTTGNYPSEHALISIDYTKHANKIAQLLENPQTSDNFMVRVIGLFYDNGGTCSNFYLGKRTTMKYYKVPQRLRIGGI